MSDATLFEQIKVLVDEMVADDDFDTWFLTHEMTKRGIETAEGEVVTDDTPRWYNRKRIVFGLDGEFVAVSWNEAATEMQEDGVSPRPLVQKAVAEPSVKYVVVK